MATDIFMFLEYQAINDFNQKEFQYWHLYAGLLGLFRDYPMFGLLGEEGRPTAPKPLFQLKGLPEEVSYGFCRAAAYVIVDYEPKFRGEKVVNRQVAEKEIKAGQLMELKVSGSEKNWRWVTENFQRASWLSASEYKLVLDEYKTLYGKGNELFEAIFPMMQILNDGDDSRTRLVYYFF